MMTKTCLRTLFLAALVLLVSHACSDSPTTCLGTPVPCADREVSDCNAGCTLESGCYGDPITCDSLTATPTLCVQTPGCRYVGSCDGVEGCKNVAYDQCAMTSGCQQVRRCYGDGTTCGTLDASQCELYPQCTRGQQCVGKATRCSELAVSSCLEVPGCLPADTTPAVVK
jgi:hypothetical protein